jgi:hypothetical protein
VSLTVLFNGAALSDPACLHQLKKANDVTALKMLISVACALLLAAGCTGGADNPDRPAVAPASGVVSYKGTPLEGATVVFIPEGGSYGAAGITDDDGRFVVAAFPPDPGAVPGNYTVIVTKTEEEVEPEGTYEDVMYKEYPPAKSLVPARYTDPKTSGLTANVPVDGTSDLQFELSD